MATRLGSTVLRRGLATLADGAILGAWSYSALRHAGHARSWIPFGVALALVLWADARPYRTAAAQVKLTRAARWLLVLRFVALAFTIAYAPYVRPELWAVVAVAVLFFVGAVLRVVEERRPLRVITAAPGGGFLVRYPADAALDAEVAGLPGGERAEEGWKFPATTAAADALLRFAREHEFEFRC